MGVFAFAAHAVLWSGCATSALWEEGRFARFHEPANPPGLRLYRAPENADVLVEYMESLDSDESRRPRSYWLDKNAARLKDRQEPVFSSRTKEGSLEPIPILDSLPSTDSRRQLGLYAVASTNGCEFTLYSGEKSLGAFVLPVYQDKSGLAKQVALTPIAVAANLTIIGGLIFVVAWSEGGLDWIH
jgi:hypothetical protein